MSVYYSPGKHGLKQVVEVNLSEPDYSFDLLVVWKHEESGKLYWAQDSGCSCPSPFEDYNSLESLDVLDDLRQVEVVLEDKGGWRDRPHVSPSERRDIMAQIMEAYVG